MILLKEKAFDILEAGQVWQFKAVIFEDNVTSCKIKDVSGF